MKATSSLYYDNVDLNNKSNVLKKKMFHRCHLTNKNLGLNT